MRRTVRCEGCQASLPTNAGRCPSCGLEVGAGRVVAVGSDAPAAGTDDRHKSRRPGIVILIAAALAIAALAVVDQGSSDPADEDATTPTRRPNIATPTLAEGPTVAGNGPPVTLPGSTGLRVVTFVGEAGIQVVDLDSGARVVVTGDDTGGAGASFAGGVARAGGLVTVSGGQVMFLPDVAPGGPAIGIDRGNAVLPSDVDDRVWVMEGEGDGATDTFVREIDMNGRRTGETTELPEGVVPIGAVTGGLALDSPDGVFVLNREGNFRRVADGSAVGAFGSSVVHRACDDNLRCSLYITDVESGGRQQVARGGEIPAGRFAEQSVSPDGRLLFSFTYTDARPDATVLDLDAGEVAFESGPEFTGFEGGAVWSPDGRWLFWIENGDTPDDSAVRALHADDWRFYELDIPGGYGLVVLGPAEPA
jgi:hypothetical protein